MKTSKRKRTTKTTKCTKRRKVRGGNIMHYISPLSGIISMIASRNSANPHNIGNDVQMSIHPQSRHAALNNMRNSMINSRIKNFRRARSMPMAHNVPPEMYAIPMRYQSNSPFGTYFGQHHTTYTPFALRNLGFHDTFAQIASNPHIQKFAQKALTSAGNWAIPRGVQWLLNKIKNKR